MNSKMECSNSMQPPMSRLSKNVVTSLLWPPCSRESLHNLERKEANLAMTKDSREKDFLCRKMLSGLVVDSIH